jgi:glycerol-3-phosphate dehydrogenase
MRTNFDVLVVGGGINGAGIARDLSGRGLTVLLCEKDDLAAHTSSASTKLIHGGLRYLEHHEFGLVRKALQEREVLLRNAPHIMWPLRFVMPHDQGMRPAWMIRLGLFLYDHLARRELLPGSNAIDLNLHPAGQALKPGFTKGFVYSDGWVDDARLVILNAMDACKRGATVLTHTTCTDVTRSSDHWTACLQPAQNHAAPKYIMARALVNAAGPWAAQFLQNQAHREETRPLRLVKGSHIVVKKLFSHDMAYIFQNTDRRITFAIPYENDFTLIGTTDVEHQGTIGEVAMDRDECQYMCEQAGRYFKQSITPADVIWSYSGVRPLLDDATGNPAAVTRDYRLDLDTTQAPLLSVWGGKITTYRKLAEQAADRLCPALGSAAPSWTANASLPGGDMGIDSTQSQQPAQDFARFVQEMCVKYSWLPQALCHRYARAYGTRMKVLLHGSENIGGLGLEVAPGLYDTEIQYLYDHEWARCAEDVIWRRSKLGLHMSVEAKQNVAEWFSHKGVGDQCA